MSGWEQIGPPHNCRDRLPSENNPVWSIWRCDCGQRWQIRMAEDFVGGFNNPDKCWITMEDR